MQFKKQQLELDIEKHTDSKSGKQYIKAVYIHPAYLFYMQSTSCEMSGWMKHKLESRLPGEIINNLRYSDDTTLMAENKELKSLLMKVKGEWKSWLKIQHSENQDHGICSHHLWQIDGETIETVRDFILGGAPKSLQMVTAVT